MALSYPLDLSQPFAIIGYDPIKETYTVSGFAKSMRSTKWMQDKTVEFGGHKCIFTIKKDQLLTEYQKRQLKWVKRHLGDKQHDILKTELCEFVNATHTFNDT